MCVPECSDWLSARDCSRAGRKNDSGPAECSCGQAFSDPFPHLLRSPKSSHPILSHLVGGGGNDAKSRAMIVTGWNQARADPVVWELLPRGFDLKWHSVEAEPALSDVAKGK